MAHLVLVCSWLAIVSMATALTITNNDDQDLRWPNGRVNVLLDYRSLNQTERLLIGGLLDQIERRTCVTLTRLPANKVNPFDSRTLTEEQRNFIFMFKAKELRQPTLGLSSLGCSGRGRQSIVLSESAFQWPDLVLKYHIMRSLGLQNLTRPEAELRRRQLAGSRIASPTNELEESDDQLAGEADELELSAAPALPMAYATKKPADYLDEQDFQSINELYECPGYQNKLLPHARTTSSDTTTQSVGEFTTTAKPADLEPPMVSTPDPAECKPMESCPLVPLDMGQPMMMKLDHYNALDPYFRLANQMKLSQIGIGSSEPLNATYRQMEGPEVLPAPAPKSKSSELMISFEQTPAIPGNDPVAALAQSQLLKLCSCTCQTMSQTPGPASTSTPSPMSSSSEEPPTEQPEPTIITTTTAAPAPTTTEPPVTTRSSEEPTTMSTSEPPQTQPATMPPPETTTYGLTEPTLAPTEPPTTSAPTPTQASDEPTSITDLPPTSSSTPPSHSLAENACDQVKWVKPNKTIYASAKIVWDVDRANENYFLCQNPVNGELVPGKTHGFSCKVSNEGKAFELHNFTVLTKPEHVNLAWVQKNSKSLGRTNLPVLGGYSKDKQEAYIVSRCLVRDENQDIITLIGYVNDQGIGWFPFDDIQIECAQYDVLACVN